ncbi:hypothetical protein JKA73_36275 [Myxococcus xanthus]|uniref:hypothetical protein n=1 Tax=Myxococcus xanthus TaxID=34 RepID=UPI0019174B07|nr:hypothetical protein [Myxococcus xanthus]QQR44365.1 hypothetical protein JKA73_36275 [Myxococcus xanthus]
MTTPGSNQRLCILVLIAASLGLTSCFHRIRCGPNDCEKGTVCCNSGCGICTGPDEACILPFCDWGNPTQMTPEDVPDTDLYDHAGGRLAYSSLTLTGDDAPSGTYSGPSALFSVQHYAWPTIAARAHLSGSTFTHVEGLDLPESERRAWSAGAGVSKSLSFLGPSFDMTANLDGEYVNARGFAGVLTPAPLSAGGRTTLAPSLVVRNAPSRWPFQTQLTAHARYLHLFARGPGDVGLLDVGVGGGIQREHVQVFGSPTINLGLGLNYRFAGELTSGAFRTHELGGGLWVTHRKLRAGIETHAGYARLTPGTDARTLTGMLRFDYYWDAEL